MFVLRLIIRKKNTIVCLVKNLGSKGEKNRKIWFFFLKHLTQNLTFWSLRRLRHTFLNVFGYELSESVLISFRVRPGFLTNLRLNVKKSCFLLKLCQKLSTIIFYLFLLNFLLNFASFDISYVKVVMNLKVWELKIDFLLLVDRPHHFFQLLNSLKLPICIQFW